VDSLRIDHKDKLNMRILTFVSCLMLVLPVAAQAQSCRGKQALDFGGGTKGCVVEIVEGSITTTRTRDDNASTRVSNKATPLVGAVMTGPVPANRGTVKKQMLAMCKATQAKVSEQFADKKYHQIILLMDWSNSGGEMQAGYSSNKCRGFQFFDS